MACDSATVMATGDLKSTAKGSAARANGGKVAMTLLPLHCLAGAARVLMGGRLKYAEWNWAKGQKFSVAVDCLLRHLISWYFLGEDNDAETGEHHLDHLICNALFLRHFLTAYPEGDDRPPQDITNFNLAAADFKKKFNEEEFRARLAALIGGSK